MPTPPLNAAECARRKAAIEECLAEGYAPLGQTGGKGSAVQEAARRLGMRDVTLCGSVRRGIVTPDWSLYKPAVYEALRGQVEHPVYGGNPVPAGFVLKGQSALVDADGNLAKRWDKTKQEGMDPAAAIKLPDPKKIVSLATLTDAEGRVVQQWSREKPDDAVREQAWREFAEELAGTAERLEPLPAPAAVNSKLMAAYPVGDHHLGMLSWGLETGASYDLEIGERLLQGAMSYLTAAAGSAEQGLVVFLGDFVHHDSFEAVTPEHRNLLDSDGRFPKIAWCAVRLMRHVIDLALHRHLEVKVIVAPGNHDPVSSVFLAMCLKIAYEREPRVTIDDSPRLYHYHRFGSVLLGVHHGHGVKMPSLPLIMAADRPEDWGETRHRVWWTGHVHNKTAQDFSGCSVESFRILPPADAWAHGKGYRPHREMAAVVFHRDFGEVARHKVNPQMLDAA